MPMIKRRSRKQIREEFVRLAAVWDVFHQQFVKDDPEFAKIGNGAQMIADFDARRSWTHPDVERDPTERQWTASMHLQGLREAIKDNMIGVYEALENAENGHQTEWARLPESYRQQTGRDFFEDAGDPLGRVKLILRRSRVSSEEDCRLLLGILNDVDQSLLTPTQARKATRLVAAFEAESTS
ncbi:MAG: hypothetical protein AB3N09_07760 [Tateyamaria sp.]